MNMCSTTGCKVVATFSSCLGVAHSSPTQGQAVWTWFEADTAVVTRQEAFDECQRAGGPACAGLNVICLTDSERRDSGAAAAAQLPPEIQADRYLRQAVRYLQLRGREAEHYTAALDLMNRAESGKVAAAAASRVESRAPQPPRQATRGRTSGISAGQTCAGKPQGAACWMELANQPGCYVWNPNLQTDETAAWPGECSGDMAQGTGTLTRVWG